MLAEVTRSPLVSFFCSWFGHCKFCAQNMFIPLRNAFTHLRTFSAAHSLSVLCFANKKQIDGSRTHQYNLWMGIGQYMAQLNCFITLCAHWIRLFFPLNIVQFRVRSFFAYLNLLFSFSFRFRFLPIVSYTWIHWRYADFFSSIGRIPLSVIQSLLLPWRHGNC